MKRTRRAASARNSVRGRQVAIMPRIHPYTAVGLVPTVRGVRRRSEIRRNLEHLADLIAAASWLSSLDLPVRLVAIPEGALQGFTDEVFDLDHAEYSRE